MLYHSRGWPNYKWFDSAKKLIEIAVKTGADAIKFQILNAYDLVADKNSFSNIRFSKIKLPMQLKR